MSGVKTFHAVLAVLFISRMMAPQGFVTCCTFLPPAESADNMSGSPHVQACCCKHSADTTASANGQPANRAPAKPVSPVNGCTGCNLPCCAKLIMTPAWVQAGPAVLPPQDYVCTASESVPGRLAATDIFRPPRCFC